MKTVRVNLENRSYDILIGSHLLQSAGRILNELEAGDGICVFTDENAGGLYLPAFLEALGKSDIRHVWFKLPPGEKTKSLEMAQQLYGFLSDNRVERSWTIAALGGGVIGDVAGFVASTFMRGIGFIQVPTTLLSQVDSSVGGKVAVNFSGMKNIVGNFYQPLVVIADTGTLSTLPVREYMSALAEVVKYGVIRDSDFFSFLERNVPGILSRDPEILEEVVERSCAIKAEIVEKDERDEGLRAILNFGHTVGHAIESVSELGSLTHGEAVALGMVVASKISEKLGLLGGTEFSRIEGLMTALDFQLRMSALDPGKVIEAVHGDKKIRGGEMRFALTDGIGSAIFPYPVQPELLKEGLTYITH